MKPILEVRDLGKHYTLKHQIGGYLSLRDRITDIFRPRAGSSEEFWALDRVSFDVNTGESLGIIGRNGAGKSTLLKILSRISPPSRGRFVSRGRIASLLEVGTGFHPELTGKENIFFNGSLLGMRRREITSKFEEIVDFSGVEKFLDTPLKHYSSGMQLRLAFAVAAFLEPEILVIDEVLAVGDAEFQRKCLGKMESVSNSGRTILFVSHNMQAMKLLCPRSIYLKNGVVKADGPTDDTINFYVAETQVSDSFQNFKVLAARDQHDPDFSLEDIRFIQGRHEVVNTILNGEDLNIEVHYLLRNDLSRFRVFVDVCDHMGTVILRSFHDEVDNDRLKLKKGNYMSNLKIPAHFLAPTTYEFRFWFGVHNVRMMQPVDGVTIRLKVENTGFYNLAYGGQYSAGLIAPKLDWEIVQK